MELNPFSHEFHEDPYPTYRWLRDQAPLYYNAELDFYALSRFRDVLAGLQDWKTYSSAEGTTVERMDPRMFEVTPMIIFMDPPRHDRLRKLVSSVFTPRRIANLEPFIRATAVRLLDELVERGGGDFVKDFSTPLPMEVIFTMLGVPDADRLQLRHWMDVSLERDRDTPALPPRALDASAGNPSALYQFFEFAAIAPQLHGQFVDGDKFMRHSGEPRGSSQRCRGR